MTNVSFEGSEPTIELIEDRGYTTPVLVLDPGVSDAEILLSGFAGPFGIVRLAYGSDPLAQIAAALAGRRGVPALHIVSHGMPGTLLLAAERIDLPALVVRSGVLSDIAAALAPGAVVTLYGCSVAAGPAGRQFLDYLEATLGATVAASAGPVGSPAQGGAWHLRTRDGSAVPPAFVVAARAAYPGVLATFTLTTGDDTPTLSSGDDIITADASSVLNSGDSIDGGAGTDVLNISASQFVTFDPTTLVNVEQINITGSGTFNFITADATIAAGQTLTVDGSGSTTGFNWRNSAETDGHLTLTGSAGRDQVTGGALADTLIGGGAQDTLYGGAGNDLLSGGAGDDTLTGGNDADTFAFNAGDGHDTILDFGTGADVVDLDATFGITSQAALDAIASDDGSGNAVLDLGNGDTITLIGVDYTTLSINAFV